ncbi:ATP-dependent DNA helicase [Actinotalea sp. K2]|nr:ATP-dependent DNA helicase [Actinotalea sp. K2]MCL3860155.1 ATP-dependent DNA helicase [Actinotalea sp. K2]
MEPDASPGQAPPTDTTPDLLDRAVQALGGVHRAGQHEMARAVADALEAREHLLVQAGTGTGKSLGYLVPALRHAVLAEERVVVSTATLALQRQVVTRDLPLVAQAVAPRLPRTPEVALLKGWHNYLCRQKVAGGYPADDPGTLFDAVGMGEGPGAAEHPAPPGGASGAGELGAQVLRLREWEQETTTGDRDDLVPGVPDKAWRQVSVTSMECLGPKCPLVDSCFPEQARARARQADVVVTNHAMLGIAAGGSPGVLPEHEVLVVDEAHELTDRVTAQATAELSAATIEHAARLARRHGGIPTTDLDSAGQALATVMAELPEGRFREGLPAGATAAVAAVRDAARSLLSALKPESGTQASPTADGGLKMATSTMLALFEIAERMTGDAAQQGHDVLWCARGDSGWGRSGASRLHAAPLAVAGLVRSHLFTGRTVVMTSATLALGGTFAPLARSVGLDTELQRTSGDPRPRRPDHDPDSPRPWRGIDVGSPFDYPRRGILYVARHLPAPGREPTTQAQLDEIEALLRAGGGGALGLFSSRRAAQAAAEAMRERLDLTVLCQGDDQLPTLVRRFAEEDSTCLFGTLSLWQGVDVPGQSCRLVMIDRIPFPRPDDPVRSARSEAVEAAGGNGFMTVAASHAALLLAQGAGRLIRTDADRGVVAVLDPRLATARYGQFLTRTMPPFWQTTDRTVALAALGRLAPGGVQEGAGGTP